MKLKRVNKAWKMFCETGNIEIAQKTNIRKNIISSWVRCYKNNLNPYDAQDKCLSSQEIKERIANNKNMIEIAKPFMQKLYQVVRGSNFAVILLDNEGYILDYFGDNYILNQFKHIRQGENWSEEIKGTNAMGLALKELEPVQVYASEHYCSPNHQLTCSAAPIKDTQNNLIGILDVTGDYRKVHPHTLGMVVAAVQAIENQLSLEKATEQAMRSYKNLTAIMESLSEGVLSFDNNGRITQINHSAASILGINVEECKGKPVTEVLTIKEKLSEILEKNTILNDYEVVVDTKQGRSHFTMSGRALRDNYGQVFGGVITIREIKSVRNLVNKMVGAQARFIFDDIIGESEPIKSAKEMAITVARSNSSVLLHGKSGTGKEMFAQAIHNASLFSNGPFVAINCAAIPRDLIESELFGYEEGAFTGAKRGGRPGKFELANGGTIFLDEVGDMPWDVQVALLRVLQDKQIIRVGGYKPIPVEIRVIAATNKNLSKLVKEGTFREDLYYRLNVIPIYIPPLKERGKDVLIIANNLIPKIASNMGKGALKMTKEVEEVLLNYDWPGNVRQLANVIERAVNVALGSSIQLHHLPDDIKNIRNVKELSYKPQRLVTLKEAEKVVIADTLNAFNGNISRAADVLGIGRNTLYRKIKNLNIGTQNTAK